MSSGLGDALDLVYYVDLNGGKEITIHKMVYRQLTLQLVLMRLTPLLARLATWRIVWSVYLRFAHSFWLDRFNVPSWLLSICHYFCSIYLIIFLKGLVDAEPVHRCRACLFEGLVWFGSVEALSGEFALRSVGWIKFWAACGAEFDVWVEIGPAIGDEVVVVVDFSCEWVGVFIVAIKNGTVYEHKFINSLDYEFVFVYKYYGPRRY